MLQTADTVASGSEASNARQQHIVVVDDDAGLRTLLTRLLRAAGYEASGASDGVQLSEILAARAADLILLDIMLPGASGLDLCRDLRRDSGVPVIIVSARGQEEDRVTGLDMGADDYIAKPFGRAELLARVRAALRRSGWRPGTDKSFEAVTLHFDGWTYHVRRRQLFNAANAEVPLTSAEQDLLLALLRHPRRIISRERLLELARQRVGHSSDRSIDILISRLRRKIGDSHEENPRIQTVRGIGYMLAVDVSER